MSVVAAASAMGILVPPCLTMVVLGSLVNLSIVTLFLAGFLPAFLLAGMLLVLIAVRARRQDWPVAESTSRADLGRAARRAVVPLGPARTALRGHLHGDHHRHGGGARGRGVRAGGGDAGRGHHAREPPAPLRAQRGRHRHDALGPGRRVGLCVDPGARVGAPDARRVDHQPRREPRRVPRPHALRLRGDRRSPRGTARALDLRRRSCSRSAARSASTPSTTAS